LHGTRLARDAFFFSSRRRHTRFSRDWSSDVCSSDLSVMQRHEQLSRDFGAAPSRLVRYASIDGLPGFVTVEGGGVLQTTALQIEQNRIVAIYVTRNPDKLRHLDPLSAH